VMTAPACHTVIRRGHHVRVCTKKTKRRR
jgi:hypothetical protein